MTDKANDHMGYSDGEQLPQMVKHFSLKVLKNLMIVS